MKFTITHRNKKNQLLVSTKSLERLLGRIVNDDDSNTVEHFREQVHSHINGKDGYKEIAKNREEYGLIKTDLSKQKIEDKKS